MLPAEGYDMIEPRQSLLAIETEMPNDPLILVVHEVCDSIDADVARWEIKQSTDPLRQWLQFYDPSVELPLQGWKLHISASASSACQVLRRVLPILLVKAASFKMTATLERLRMLNQGGAGKSQIGKFITIYPRDDDEAVELASDLDQATVGLEGLSIPSDRVLRPGSLVHYRYGGFSAQLLIQNSIGLIIPAIKAPEHELEPDLRHVPYQPPSWAIDPFVHAGIAVDLPPLQRLIGNRYLIVAIIATSMNSTISLGCDLGAARTCVIKGPGFAHYYNYDGGSRFKIHYEIDILRRLVPNKHIPTPFDVIEQDGNHYFVMEDIEGETLDTYRNKLMARGRYLLADQLLTWGIQLARLLGAIHARGLVYTDLKPSNIMIDVENRLRLIDFELTHESGDADPKWSGCGTPGYMSPLQQSGQAVTVADDIYSFGALLYALVTGTEPSYAPKGHALLDRPIELLNPAVGVELKAIVECCLANEPRERYASMDELALVLEQIDARSLFTFVPFGGELAQEDVLVQDRYRALSQCLFNTLRNTACRLSDPDQIAWESSHPISYGLMARDINSGNSGTLLALAELDATLVLAGGRDILRAGSAWLDASAPKSIQPLPGLYVGEAGVGAALLRAGQVMHDHTLIEKAALRGCTIARLPYGSPDLFNGTAGRLRFHLLLWDELQEQEILRAARACGEHLVATAITNERDETCWRIPDGYDSLSGQCYLGYAHGAAGVADTLLDLFEVTGDECLLPVIQGTGRWLTRLATPTLEDQSGLNWSRTEGEPPTAAFWCHGAAGIGRFFLHAARTDLIPGALDIATRAARMVARGTRNAGPTQCHGLAGNIEFLLDVYRETGDRAYLNEAHSLARLLEAFAQERDGHLVFSAERPDVFTPDYMVGYAGVALCFLRLSDPDRIPHQLSREGFRYRT